VDTDTLGKIEFPIKASVVVSIVVLLLSLLYWLATRSLPQTILFFTGAGAAAGAILAAFYSARSLAINAAYLEREEKRRKKDLALERAARWNDPTMYHVRDVVRELFDSDHTSEAFQRNLRDKKTNVIHFLNFLEEIAIVIEYGEADERILREAFEGVISTACSKLHSWISTHRINRGRPRIWIKLEELGKRWN
jgi:Domain of unknown function (DUF4760)